MARWMAGKMAALQEETCTSLDKTGRGSRGRGPRRRDCLQAGWTLKARKQRRGQPTLPGLSRWKQWTEHDERGQKTLVEELSALLVVQSCVVWCLWTMFEATSSVCGSSASRPTVFLSSLCNQIAGSSNELRFLLQVLFERQSTLVLLWLGCQALGR
ncbi:hypothetical protein BD289DRAFT_432908 [Coniella lustricola]|uniref:Uncharacterized protein n=1 Tax=Coniella lustricola TaxID=2025994 RepID=A0A2T3A9A9_9PEZI|nr:hypothetical protein BD289DRAFT_432908 [Coniella lustricola]